MIRRLLVVILFVGGLVSCQRKPAQIQSIHEEVIVLDGTYDSIQDTAYLRSLAPITEQLDKELNVVIGYAPRAMRPYLPESEMLNWTCDALYDMAKQYYDGEIDFAVVNIGGIRCSWDKGDITRRDVFELMPFDNQLVILTLTGEKVLELCDCFAKNGGQGVSKQLRMSSAPLLISADAPNDRDVPSSLLGKPHAGERLYEVTIHGKAIDADAVYYVATSDYLSTGADHLTPLAEYLERKSTDKLIRDLYMEYIIREKTVEARIDGRMKLM